MSCPGAALYPPGGPPRDQEEKPRPATQDQTLLRRERLQVRGGAGTEVCYVVLGTLGGALSDYNETYVSVSQVTGERQSCYALSVVKNHSHGESDYILLSPGFSLLGSGSKLKCYPQHLD